MIIGSHGMTHRILTGLKDAEMDYELRASKELLEHNLGASIDSLSIPRGCCNKMVIEKAKDFGYKSIFTSDNRIAVKVDWDLGHFIRLVDGKHTVSEKVGKLLKESSKKLLGETVYDRIRTRILK